eukprot:766629-Hanusia_phi.AAC.5
MAYSFAARSPTCARRTREEEPCNGWRGSVGGGRMAPYPLPTANCHRDPRITATFPSCHISNITFKFKLSERQVRDVLELPSCITRWYPGPES